MIYEPIIWADEIPESTPVKYRIKDSGGAIIQDNVTLEVVTPVTNGTPLNATNLNHLEGGVKDAQDTANSALVAAQNAQTDADKAVYLYSLRDVPFQVPMNLDKALTTNAKRYIRIPEKLSGGTLVKVVAFCKNGSTSGDIEFGLKNGNTSMLTTNVTIDQGETDSKTAVVAPAIGANNQVFEGDLLEISTIRAGTGVLFSGVEITIRPAG